MGVLAIPAGLETWASFGPLSWDVSVVLRVYRAINAALPVKWAVIGAASKG
jgi:hypothetical protein